MSGGGDTPPTNTWKHSIGGPGFLAGDFNEEDVGQYVVTVYSEVIDSNNNALVIVDGHAQTLFYGDIASTMRYVVSQIEQKYGITVSEWIYLTGRYNVGNDIPYWDTYEAI